MRKFITVFIFSTAAATLAAGCKPTVDCEKLKERLTGCMVENYKTLNPKGRDIEKPEFLDDRNKLAAKYTEIIDEKIIKECEANGGKDVRAAKINKCLKYKSCVKVHACLKKVLK